MIESVGVVRDAVVGENADTLGGLREAEAVGARTLGVTSGEVKAGTVDEMFDAQVRRQGLDGVLSFDTDFDGLVERFDPATVGQSSKEQ